MKLKKDNGNIKIIIAIVVIILVLIIGIIVVKKSSKKNDIIIKNEPYKYFTLNSSNGKLGVVDINGNVVINPEYENIYIPNQSKDVFVCFKDETNYSIINKEGQDLFQNIGSVYCILISDTSLEMEKNVLLYEKDNKYGLIDYEGKKITEAIYDEIISLPNKPGYLRVKKDDLYGVMDSLGNFIIDIKYNSIVGDDFSTSSGYDKAGFIISEKTKEGIIYGYINSEGQMLISPKYEMISRAQEYEDDDIYLIFMENGKKGVIKNKKILIKPKYQSINYYNLSNVFVVGRNAKYGFFNNSGDEILPVEYTSYSIAGNYISVKKEELMLLYDLHGNLVDTNNYKSIIETDNPTFFIAQDDRGFFSVISKDFTVGNNYKSLVYAFDNFFVFTTEDDKAGILDVYSGVEVEATYDYIIILENARALEARKGNSVDIYSEKIEKTLTMDNAIVEKISDDYFSVYSKLDKKYIDSNGNLVKNTDVFKNLNFYSYQSEDEKWGFIDNTGAVKVEAKYDMVTELNEYGFAGIYDKGKWGVIDSNGNVIVEPTYEIETYYEPNFIGKYLLDEGEFLYCTEISNK